MSDRRTQNSEDMNQAKINTSQVKTALVAERQSRWVAASSTSAATTGAMVAVLYLTSAIGWTIAGKVPAPGWGAIVAGTLAGAIFGGRDSPLRSSQQFSS